MKQQVSANSGGWTGASRVANPLPSLLSAWLFLAPLASTLLGCNRDRMPAGLPSLNLTSDTLSGGVIPETSACTREDCPCDGKDVSPELSWSSPPAHTQSFAMIVTDKDSLFGWSFVHWVLYDVPADKRELPQGIAKQKQLPDGSRQGQNDFDKIGYVGPCPPGHSPHHYAFDLYALDTKLNLPPGASKKQVQNAMKGHILAAGELIGRF
jgi:Raf kinase inhibitor-like YbhB/YbcL family protein